VTQLLTNHNTQRGPKYQYQTHNGTQIKSIHLSFTGFKGLCVCVRPGRLLYGLLLILVWFVCGRVYFDLFRFYLLSFIIFNFVCSWDTRRWIKSKNTIRLILIHHRQNPTKMIYVKLRFCVFQSKFFERRGQERRRQRTLNRAVASIPQI
jgi:hypothetical protein